jgi:hypothetical protein
MKSDSLDQLPISAPPSSRVKYPLLELKYRNVEALTFRLNHIGESPLHITEKDQAAGDKEQDYGCANRHH